jgi:hypothetical protein
MGNNRKVNPLRGFGLAPNPGDALTHSDFVAEHMNVSYRNIRNGNSASDTLRRHINAYHGWIFRMLSQGRCVTMRGLGTIFASFRASRRNRYGIHPDQYVLKFAPTPALKPFLKKLAADAGSENRTKYFAWGWATNKQRRGGFSAQSTGTRNQNVNLRSKQENSHERTQGEKAPGQEPEAGHQDGNQRGGAHPNVVAGEPHVDPAPPQEPAPMDADAAGTGGPGERPVPVTDEGHSSPEGCEWPAEW